MSHNNNNNREYKVKAGKHLQGTVCPKNICGITNFYETFLFVDYREYLDTILSKIIKRTLASVASLNGVLKTIFPFGYYFASVLKCDKLRDNHGKKQCSNCIIKALHHCFALRNPQ